MPSLQQRALYFAGLVLTGALIFWVIQVDEASQANQTGEKGHQRGTNSSRRTQCYRRRWTSILF